MNTGTPKINVDLQALIRGSFYCLIFFLPISIALVKTFSGFVIFFFVIKRVRACVNAGLSLPDRQAGAGLWRRVRNIFAPSPDFLNRPLMFLTIAVLLSVIFSEYPATSLVSFFAKFLEGVFLYAAFLEAFDSQERINNFIWVWFGSALLTGMSGLCQYWRGIDFLRLTSFSGGRISSCLRHANDFGAYIGAVFPLLAALIFKPRSNNGAFMSGKGRVINNPVVVRVFLIVAFVVLLVCLGLTFSRGAWVGVFTAVLFLGLQKKKRLFAVIFTIIVFIIVFTPFMVKARDATLFTDHARYEQKALVENAREYGVFSARYWKKVVHNTTQGLGLGRLYYWKEALGVLYDHPLFGSGLNTYSKVAPRYKVSWGGYPHNSYLQMAAELGFVGITAFLWFLVVFFDVAFIRLSTAATGLSKVLLLGVLAGFLAYLVQSFFDTSFYSVQLGHLMWIIMGLGMALKRQIDKI